MSVSRNISNYIDRSKGKSKIPDNLYERGLTAKAVLKYTGDLSKENQKKMLEAMQEFINSNSNPSGIFPLPFGYGFSTS